MAKSKNKCKNIIVIDKQISILFGKKVKAWRKKNNLTQTELANLMSVGRHHIVLLEAGKNTDTEVCYKTIFLLKKYNIDLNIWFNDIFISLSDDYKKEYINKNFQLF